MQLEQVLGEGIMWNEKWKEAGQEAGGNIKLVIPVLKPSEF